MFLVEDILNIIARFLLLELMATKKYKGIEIKQ